MARLRNKVALIIGGAAGMGIAAARALAFQNAEVIIADRDSDAAARAADDIVRSGGLATARAVDGTSLPQLQALFAFVERDYGKLNLLFNNVGTRCADGFEIDETDYNEAFDTNLKSQFFAANLAAPLLRRCAPHAVILIMSSAGGLRTGGRSSPLYATSKASAIMMAQAFARHLGPDGIRVHALCPGHIDTAFARASSGLSEPEYNARMAASGRDIPLGRIGQPSDVASVITFLASDEAMFLSGLAVAIDGGRSA